VLSQSAVHQCQVFDLPDLIIATYSALCLFSSLDGFAAIAFSRLVPANEKALRIWFSYGSLVIYGAKHSY